MKRIVTAFTVLFFLFSTIALCVDKYSTGIDGLNVRPKEIVLKLKSNYRSSVSANTIQLPGLQMAFQELGVTDVRRIFPNALQPENDHASSKQVDLSLLFQVKYKSAYDEMNAAKLILGTGVADYAEPFFIHEALLTPNDTDISQQYYLTNIQAYAGWDISTGDSTVVIGIVDSGTDWDHPDLQVNVKLNSADPIDNIDNDSDGFIDNYRGWDMSENDNDPVVGIQVHGSRVSGCAAAVTNNTSGVAGAGFNSRFLPVKASYNTSSTSIDHGYEGIVYAADHGCAVINCSWGRKGGPSQFEQDVINYATFNRNALVVAAAGNTGSNTNYFPASYDHVVSVAATDQVDKKSSTSSYSYTVDVCAPGNNIYNTVYNNSYGVQSGTSLATPLVSGCAAIVKSYYPLLTPKQLAARLRATSDDIYSVPGNSFYINKLGKGRINLYRALVDSVSPGVEISQLKITDNKSNAFLANDTLRISALFTNYLSPSVNLVATISSASTYVSFLNQSFNIGVLGTMDTISNISVPFEVLLSGSVPLNTPVDFVITLTDTGYSDFYAFQVSVNIDYVNITVNDVSTTVNSRGRIGYNKTGEVEGLGFTYLNDSSLLYEGGLMVGISSSQVSDAIRNSTTTSDDDFTMLSSIRRQQGVAAFEASGVFDDQAASAPVGVRVSQYVYAWDNVPHRKYVIVKYVMKNTNTSALNNLWTGIFADWDLPYYEHNKTASDVTRKLGYVWSPDSLTLYTGVKVLSHAPFNHYAIDFDSSGLGGVNVFDGFSTAEKYVTLTTSRHNAGATTAEGKDIISIVSTGPFSISPNDSISVAFAILAGDSLASLQLSADDAQILFDSLLIAVEERPTGDLFFSNLFPNPASHQLTLAFYLQEPEIVELNLYDLSGRKISVLFSGKLEHGMQQVTAHVESYSSGLYLLQVVAGNHSSTMKISILKD